MKRLFYFVFLAVVCVCGCQKEAALDASFKVDATELSFASNGGEAQINVTAHEAWTATAPKWITLTPRAGVESATVKVKVAASFDTETRVGAIDFTVGEKKYSVKVSQIGVLGLGSGTKEDPYLVTSISDLNMVATLTNSDAAEKYAGKYFQQTTDIDATGVAFTPLGNKADAPFRGNYDGCGFKIKGLTIANTAQNATGFVAYAKGATIKGVNLTDANIDSKYVYAGAIAGCITDTTLIENCSVSGLVRTYEAAGINLKDTNVSSESVANMGLCGGIVGLASNYCTIKGCSVNADVTLYGKFSGGVVGCVNNCVVEDCHFEKERPLNIYYHFAGGIIGRARGKDTIVKGCSFEGNFTVTGYVVGGIVGQMFGGKVQDCVLGSYAYMGSDKYSVGGICGTIQPEFECVVENCASYGTIRGQYGVGGIVGYVGVGSGASDTELQKSSYKAPVTIKNCAMIGGNVTTTGRNSTTVGGGYGIAGGILGWSHGGNKLTINGCYAIPGLIQSTDGRKQYSAIAGISGYQNNTSGSIVYENCYSAFKATDMLNCNEFVSADPNDWYAGVHVRCTTTTTVKDCFSEESLRVGFSSSKAEESGCEQFSLDKMKDGTLLAKLNSTSDGTAWIAGADGFPTFASLPADPHVKPVAKKKISVIGDSISTFRGWIPAGFATHYPATDGTLTLVNETYWYRLAHDYMKSAEIDVNIAYSGSSVTNTTEKNMLDKYGSSQHWFNNSFVQRFEFCGGCGHPDIILLHGGTNDWAHNCDPLAPGVQIRNDSNSYLGHAPSTTQMNSIFAVADAAITRPEVNALPDATFFEAYTKMICQIKQRYPSCKVVCIIGDYLSQSIEESIIAIAKHYESNCRVVNLFRVNGFNDLGGYSSSEFKNKGRQPNIPKHDYAGDVSGCHPNSEGMRFMANKIYEELGTWLEAD